MNHEREIYHALGSLKIITKTINVVNVGRDDSTFEYLLFYNFTSLDFKESLEMALQNDGKIVYKHLFHSEVLFSKDRTTVSSGGVGYHFDFLDDIELKLWLYDLVKSVFLERTKNERRELLSTNFKLCTCQFATELSLYSHSGRYILKAYYIDDLTKSITESEKLEITKKAFDDMLFLIESDKKSDTIVHKKLCISPLIYIYQFFNIIQIEKIHSAQNVSADNVDYFKNIFDKYRVVRDNMVRDWGKFSSTHPVSIKSSSGIRTGVVQNYIPANKKYLISYPLSVNKISIEEVTEEQITSLYKPYEPKFGIFTTETKGGKTFGVYKTLADSQDDEEQEDID